DLDVHVTNAQGGANLSGAAVALTGPSSSVQGTTNAQGIAHFSQLPAGTYTGTVSLLNFSNAPVSAQVRINQSNLANVQLTPSIGNLEVHVVDNLNAAVRGADVTVTPASGPALAVVQTDAVGRAGFTNVPVGTVSVRAHKTGFNDATGSVAVTPGALATLNLT